MAVRFWAKVNEDGLGLQGSSEGRHVGMLITSLRRCLIAICAAAGLVMFAAADAAGGPGWSIQTIGPVWDSLEDVSCISHNVCTAVGGAGGEGTLVERWDSARWSMQPTPHPTDSEELFGVSCTSSTYCVGVGSTDGFLPNGNAASWTLAEHWDGTRWTIQSTPNRPGALYNHLLRVSCTSNTACIAVGVAVGVAFDRALVERWNGRRWSIQPTPLPDGADADGLSDVTCTASTDCTAVGTYRMSVNPDIGGVPMAERWDGRRWSLQTVPQPVGQTYINLNGVSCSASAACTAVGDAEIDLPTGNVIRLTLAEQWDGTRWTIQSTPNQPGAVSNGLADVSCASRTACTAVGAFSSHYQSPSRMLAERWDGASWSIEPVTSPGQLRAVSCTSLRRCTAVGGSQVVRSMGAPTLGVGSAQLTGTPLVCARTLSPRVDGRDISSVTWSLDGRPIRGRSEDPGTRYAVSITLSPGAHELTAKVDFRHRRARTFHRTVYGCALAPPVTG
jgi:hypothetical protein